MSVIDDPQAAQSLTVDEEHEKRLNAIVAQARRMKPTRVHPRKSQKLGEAPSLAAAMGQQSPPLPPLPDHQAAPPGAAPLPGATPPALPPMPDHQAPVPPPAPPPPMPPPTGELGSMAAPPDPGSMPMSQQPPAPSLSGGPAAPPEGPPALPASPAAAPPAAGGPPAIDQPPSAPLGRGEGALSPSAASPEAAAAAAADPNAPVPWNTKMTTQMAESMGLGPLLQKAPDFIKNWGGPIGAGILGMLSLYFISKLFKGGAAGCATSSTMYGKEAWESVGGKMSLPAAGTEEYETKMAMLAQEILRS